MHEYHNANENGTVRGRIVENKRERNASGSRGDAEQKGREKCREKKKKKKKSKSA